MISADVSATTIRPCGVADLPALFSIVNDAAQAYNGVIPADCWHDPYMPLDQRQIETSVVLAKSETTALAGGRIIDSTIA